MARRATRDMTIEECDRWCEATDEIKDVMEATAEEGGPRVSFVPEPKSVPVDFPPRGDGHPAAQLLAGPTAP